MGTRAAQFASAQSWHAILARNLGRSERGGVRLEPILHYRTAQALMNSDSAVATALDEAFPLEAIPGGTHYDKAGH
jgi:hypothetical protein